MPDAASPFLDARPIRAIAADTLWDQAIRRRDECAAMICATLAAEKVEALVYVSEPGIYPPWATMEAWMPAGTGEGRCRAKLEAIIDTLPFNETKLVTTLRLTRGSKTLAVERRPGIAQSDVAEWVRCALSARRKPHGYSPFKDACLNLVSSFAPFASFAHQNRIAAAFRATFGDRLAQNWPLAVGLTLGFACLIAGYTGVGALLVGAGALVGYVLRRNTAYATYVPEQPIDVPRYVVLVDSWHAVVADLGADQKPIRDRLIAKLSEKPKGAADIVARSETYGYRTPNGFEERQRFVLRKGQAIVYVHLYAFGNDMFVGWSSYLNWAQWSETKAVSSKMEPSRAVEFRELRNFGYTPNHLDVIDLNSLGEFVHRRLEVEIKAILKEKKIDQEIDFKIIRGDRGSALDEKSHGDDKAKGKRRGGMKYVEAGSA